jgi:UDP-N-acetylglucosamine--N-acetylmuramyl-(pentapeptide) pyrophosphoryl-undecaprenol N-acetylglucosamine transferase
MPALAVADALRRRGAEVSFIGVRGRAGSELVAARGYTEDRISMRGLARRLTPVNIVALGLAALALPKALRALRRRRADVVIAAGGYVGGPVALAAWLSRRPLMLTEADSHLGLANRLAAPLAKRVALAFPLAGRGGAKYLVTGRPVTEEVRSATRVTGRRALGIDPAVTCVLIAGGSQGAQTLNTAALDAFGSNPPIDILHVAGPRNVDEVRRELERRQPGSRYRLVGFLDNFHDAIAAADLVVTRSGGSVFEIAAIGRPSILVPYPYATNDHQAKNAAWLAEAGAAVVLPDGECDGERLRNLVGALLSDREGLTAMAEAARAIGRPESADVIADAALALVKA